MHSVTRGRLLASAALGAGLTMLPSQPALAACTVTATTVVCDDTTTTDTTNAGATPASDREYPVDTSAADFTGTVNAGAVVDGFGLAFTNTVGGTNDLIVINNGAVEVSAGNDESAGGEGALRVNAIDATNIDYSGTGSISNLGNDLLGDGLVLTTTGTGNITADIGGDITTTSALSWGVNVFHSGTAGNVSIATGTGTTIEAGEIGISAQIQNAANAGSVTVVNESTISSRAAALNTLAEGISASSAGTGTVSVTNNGAIGASGDRVQSIGIDADITNAASTAALTVDGSGAIFSAGVGISANNLGSGLTTVNYTGAVDTTGAIGVDVDATGGGGVDLTLGDVTSAGFGVDVDVSGGGSFTGTSAGALSGGTGEGIEISVADAGSIDFTSTGSITSADNNAISAFITSATGGDITLNLNDVTSDPTAAAVNAFSVSDTGSIDVTTNGDVTGGGGISAGLSSGTATGNIILTSNGTITADILGISAINSGSGDIAITAVGPVTGSTTNGILASASGGNITIAAADVTGVTNGIIATQNDAADDGDISIVTTGAVTAAVGIDATNAGTGGVSVTTGAGLVEGTAGSAIVAENTNALSLDDVVVDIGAGGATGTGADAVIATTLGTGAVTVTTAGPVTSDTGNGIFTSATTGATTIDVGGDVTGAMDGVQATGTAGTIDVTVTSGTVTGTAGDGIQAISDGNRTVTIAAGATVTGDQGIRTGGTGTTTLTNAGTITGTGGVALWANNTADGAWTITNSAGGTIDGLVDLTVNDDSFTNAGTWEATGSNVFNLGTDIVTNQATGVINTDATTSFNGLETLDNAGTLNAEFGLLFDGGDTVLTNTGDINAAGTIDFGAGTDDFANDAGGVFSLTGDTTLAGLETFSNDGTIALDTFTLTGPAIAFVNTGTIDTDGDAAVTGFTTFDNDGVLDLGPGTLTVIAGVPLNNTGDILADEGVSAITGQTVFNNSGTIDLQDGAVGDVLTIDSDFVGSGGSSLLVDFTGSLSDQLVIDGDAGGSTAIGANYLGGGFNLDGVLVVDALTAETDAFVLGSVTGETPLVDVSLVQEGADFFLVAAPTEATFDPLIVPGFAGDLWYQSADEIFAETVKPATTVGVSFWGNGYISRDKYGDDDDSVVIDGTEFDVDSRLKTKRRGIQLGVDYGFGDGRVGLTGGYAWAKANGRADADLKARGWNLGLYGQFGGLTGFHGEFLAKHDRFKGEFDDGAFDGEEFDIRSTGIDGSLGYRFGMGAAATMDVHAGLSHVRTKVDDISAFGFDYDIGKHTSTRGRAGVRAIFGGGIAPYVDATVYREFSGDGDVELFDGGDTYALSTNGKATWVRLEAGLSGNNGPGPILAAWGDVGDRKGLGLRAGWRFGGARVVEAAPPPVYVPPPAPPAPATQTCPDGSVILATDSCPPAPEPYVPPPPPPPAPERG